MTLAAVNKRCIRVPAMAIYTCVLFGLPLSRKRRDTAFETFACQNYIFRSGMHNFGRLYAAK